MKNENLQRTQPHAAGRVQMLGTVAGVRACELIADGDEIVAGSDPACDLPIFDPLLPPRAFRLRRIKCHAGTGEQCRCHWIIESGPHARVFVNKHITRRERLHFGDTVETGCHRFVFARADAASRNLRLHQNVADLCQRLLSRHDAPIGFLKNSPFHRYARRLRKGLSVAGTLAALLLMLLLLNPREDRFESVVSPLEIQVAESVMASPEAVRSLDAVVRQAFQPTELPPDVPDLAEKAVALPPEKPAQPRLQEVATIESPELTAEPIDLGKLEPIPSRLAEVPDGVRVQRPAATLESSAPAPRRELAHAGVDIENAQLAAFKPARNDAAVVRAIQQVAALDKPDMPAATPDRTTWHLPVLPPAPIQTVATAVSRETAALTGSTPPLRRLSLSEAVQTPAQAGETAELHARAISLPTAGVVTRAAVRDVLAAIRKPTAEGLNTDSPHAIEQLAAYKASPIGFESFKGMQVPVVRLSEQLQQLEPTGTADPISVDGVVSKSEMAISWKSGRFNTHAPGQPPPVADPPTYCFVGKTEINGKTHLYIAFTCVDPDISQLLARSGGGNAAELIRDDSVEIFLDTNNDRKDYFQIIANAKGGVWSGYYPRPAYDGKAFTEVQPWDAHATVKAGVTRDPSQWTCEVVIPFDRLGGMPAKGTRWAVNFARNFRGQGADWQLQSWFAVYDKQRNFHHPNLFGIFEW